MQIYIREIRKASKKTIDDLARIHQESFDGFFLSFMGKSFLKNMYRSYIEHEDSGILVALTEGEVVGLLAYSYDMDALYKFMAKRHTVAFAMSIIPALIKKPKIVAKKIRRFFAKSEVSAAEVTTDETITNELSDVNYNNLKKKILKLSSLCVLPSYQRRGIGAKLTKSFIDAKVKADYSVSLDTDEANNDEVLNFYKHNGFIEKRHFETPDGRKMIEFTLQD